MNGFVPNLNEKFNSLVVLFTHDASLRKLKVELTKLKASAQGELSEFLDHLSKYVNEKGDALLIDPTNADIREHVVQVIKDSDPLETRADSFRFFLPTDTRMLLVCSIYPSFPARILIFVAD